MLESHIFQYGFMFGYDEWIFHGEDANVMGSSSVLEPNVGIPKWDEMFDVLGDIISDDAKGNPIGTQSFNVQYDELFTALSSELYPGVSSSFFC